MGVFRVAVVVFGAAFKIKKGLRSVSYLQFPIVLNKEWGSHEALRPCERVLVDTSLRTKPRLWKVLEITKAWKFPTISGNVNAFMI